MKEQSTIRSPQSAAEPGFRPVPKTLRNLDLKTSNFEPVRLGLSILLLASLLAGCGGKKEQAGAYHPVPVRRGNLQITVLETGNVQPHNQLVIYPPISGRIEKIYVQEGQRVRKGQKLMDLSSTERATLLDMAAAQGPKVLAHWEQLYQETPLLSPENGQVIYLPTVQGQIVNTGTELMIMSDHLIVNTQVDETDLSQVKLGQEAFITLDAYPDQPFHGKVRRISYQSTLVNNVTTYEVDVWPDKVPSFMRSGMTANVVFDVNEKDDILLVPSEALQQERDGQSYVLLAPADPKGRPQTVTVQTGLTDGKRTEVVSGLKEGEKVLLKGFSAGQWSPSSAGKNPFMPNFRGGNSHGSGGHGH